MDTIVPHPICELNWLAWDLHSTFALANGIRSFCHIERVYLVQHFRFLPWHRKCVGQSPFVELYFDFERMSFNDTKQILLNFGKD